MVYVCPKLTSNDVILAEDFIVPNIKWKDNCATEGPQTYSAAKCLLDVQQQSGLKQLVISPTRMQNILDLVFANEDSFATKLEVTAGISDQDMVLLDLLVHALKGKVCIGGKSSLGTKILPSQWKEGNICDLFKKGRRSNLENYSPISLTCTVYNM